MPHSSYKGDETKLPPLVYFKGHELTKQFPLGYIYEDTSLFKATREAFAQQHKLEQQRQRVMQRQKQLIKVQRADRKISVKLVELRRKKREERRQRYGRLMCMVLWLQWRFRYRKLLVRQASERRIAELNRCATVVQDWWTGRMAIRSAKAELDARRRERQMKNMRQIQSRVLGIGFWKVQASRSKLSREEEERRQQEENAKYAWQQEMEQQMIAEAQLARFCQSRYRGMRDRMAVQKLLLDKPSKGRRRKGSPRSPRTGRKTLQQKHKPKRTPPAVESARIL